MAYTSFGKSIKKRLIDMDTTQEWLYGQVSEKTGLYFDSSYLSKIMRGVYVPEKMVKAICDILSIPEPRSDNPDSKNAPQHSGAERSS